MNDIELNFISSIKNLEKLNQDYIQLNRDSLEVRSPIQIGSSTLSVNSSMQSATAMTSPPVIINDYVRMGRVYCLMLWIYWESLSTPKNNSNLNELRMIRNCLAHHGGDLIKHSQDPVTQYANEGALLLSAVQGKSFVKNYNLIFEEADLVHFTRLVKAEFARVTGHLI